MVTKKRRIIFCLLGFCLCLNLLFPAIVLAEPDPEDGFIGGDNYYGIIDEVVIHDKAIILAEPEPEPELIPEDGFIGGDNYYGIIDEVVIHDKTIILAEPEPEPEPMDGFIGGNSYYGIMDEITIYDTVIVPVRPFIDIYARWSLDSVRDKVAVDSGGYNNYGIIRDATLTTGLIGNAFEFDGVDDYVEVPLSPTIKLTTSSFSIEAWVKTTTDAPLADKGVVGNYVTATTPYWMLKQCGEAEADRGKFAFSVCDAGGTAVNIKSKNSLHDGQWHHLVGVRSDMQNKVAFYVDGVLMEEVEVSLEDVNSGQNVCLGLHQERYFQGLLDEVTIYGRALSAEEVAQNYQKLIFLKNIKMTNKHNGEITDFCTFGVHKNNLEFDLQKTVGKLVLKLNLPSSVKIKEIAKVFKKDENGTDVLLENPGVTFTEDGTVAFTQLLEAGHYKVELLMNIDEHLTVKAESFHDEKELKINYDSDIFGFKFMDSDAMPNVL